MKWLKKNRVEIILGLGLIIFLVTYMGEEYIVSVPLVVLGLIMLYKRHYRNNFRSYSAESFLEYGDDDDDDLYEEAKEVVTEAGKASTSFIQRKLRIGYSRSARLMDLLEENGVVGPADGAKPREILEKKDDA